MRRVGPWAGNGGSLQGVGRVGGFGAAGVWSSAVGVRGSGVGVRGSGVGVRGSGVGVRGSAVGVRGSGVGVRGSGVGVRGSGVGVRGSGVGVRGSGVGVRGSGVGVRGSGVGVMGSGVGVRGSGVGVRGSGVGVRGSGVGVRGSGVGVRGSGVGVMGSGVGVRGGAVGVRGSGVGVRGSGVGVRGSGVGVRGSGVGVRPTAGSEREKLLLVSLAPPISSASAQDSPVVSPDPPQPLWSPFRNASVSSSDGGGSVHGSTWDSEAMVDTEDAELEVVTDPAERRGFIVERTSLQLRVATVDGQHPGAHCRTISCDVPQLRVRLSYQVLYLVDGVHFGFERFRQFSGRGKPFARGAGNCSCFVGSLDVVPGSPGSWRPRAVRALSVRRQVWEVAGHAKASLPAGDRALFIGRLPSGRLYGKASLPSP